MVCSRSELNDSSERESCNPTTLIAYTSEAHEAGVAILAEFLIQAEHRLGGCRRVVSELDKLQILPANPIKTFN
jgi:hypothetical protein